MAIFIDWGHYGQSQSEKKKNFPHLANLLKTTADAVFFAPVSDRLVNL